MISFQDQLPDEKLDTIQKRAQFAKKHFFKKNPNKQFVLLMLNAHFRPIALITFNGLVDIPTVGEEIVCNLVKEYHKQGYVILFKNTDDNEVENHQPMTSITIALHDCLSVIAADVNDVMLIGQKNYHSMACEKTNSLSDKTE